MLEARERGTPVCTRVDEAVELVVLVARDEDRLATNFGGVVIVDLGQLALVGQIHPVAFKDVFHLQLEQLRAGEHFAFAAEFAFGFVFLEQ